MGDKILDILQALQLFRARQRARVRARLLLALPPKIMIINSLIFRQTFRGSCDAAIIANKQ